MSEHHNRAQPIDEATLQAQYANELLALNLVSQKVANGLSSDTVIDTALDAILETIRPDLVIAFLLEGEQLVLQNIKGSTSSEPDHFNAEHHAGQCLCGLAVSEGKPKFSRDIHRDARCTMDECKAAGFRSFAALPLVSQNKIIGVLGLASNTQRDFAEQSAFLMTLANQVAIAITNAILYNDAQRRAGKLVQQIDERTFKLEAVNKKLAHEIADRKLSMKALIREVLTNTVIADLSQMLLERQISIDEISRAILRHAQQLTESAFGYAGHIDLSTGRIVSINTSEFAEQHDIDNQAYTIEHPEDLWYELIENKHKQLADNDYNELGFIGIPERGIPPKRFLAVPALLNHDIVGLVALLNPDNDFNHSDLLVVKRLAALYALAIQRQRTETTLSERTLQLGERVKELSCLYGISQIIMTPGLTIEEILQQSVLLIPPAWQDSQNTCARITYEERVYETYQTVQNNTSFRLFENIIVNDQPAGMVEVFYSGRLPKTGKLSLTEGHQLLEAIAERLGGVIERLQIEQAEREQRLLAEALQETTAAINSTLHVDDVLERILENIAQVVPHTGAGIVLVRAGVATVERFTAQTSDSLRAGIYSLQLRVANFPNIQKMLETGEPFILLDLQNLEFDFDFSEVRARGMLFAPIRLLHETPGFIALVSDKPDYFTPRMATRLMALANQAAVTLRNAQLYEQAQEVAVLEERQRLARDLHDAVSQTLFSASITAQMLPRLWDKSEEKVREGLDSLVALTQGAQAEMRMLLLELRPQAFKDTPINDLFRHLAQAHTAKTGVPVELNLTPVPPLPPVQKQAIYRIVQETLNNSMKHAQAKRVAINLLEDTEQVKLEIEDDGKGFNVDAVLPGRLGLAIMHERAESIAAELDISSAPSKGTKITLIWPR